MALAGWLQETEYRLLHNRPCGQDRNRWQHMDHPRRPNQKPPRADRAPPGFRVGAHPMRRADRAAHVPSPVDLRVLDVFAELYAVGAGARTRRLRPLRQLRRSFVCLSVCAISQLRERQRKEVAENGQHFSEQLPPAPRRPTARRRPLGIGGIGGPPAPLGRRLMLPMPPMLCSCGRRACP